MHQLTAFLQQVFMFYGHILFLFKKKSTSTVVNVVLVVANRGQHFYSARGERELRQEDNTPSPSCEACREHTNVTSPEAVGVLRIEYL